MTLKTSLREALQKKMDLKELDKAVWNKAWAKYVRCANTYNSPQLWLEEIGEDAVVHDLETYYTESRDGAVITQNRIWHAERHGHCVGLTK